jgi:hypothetical protein
MMPHLFRYQGLAVDDYSFVPELAEGLVEGLPWIWGILDFRSITVQRHEANFQRRADHLVTGLMVSLPIIGTAEVMHFPNSITI